MSLDYTTSTAVDPNSRVSEAPTTLTYTLVPRDEDTYNHWDMGAGHYSANFQFYVDITATAHSGTSTAVVYPIVLANIIDDEFYIQQNDDMLGVQFNTLTGGTAAQIQIRESVTGTTYATSAYSASVGTTYYLDFYRDETVGTYGTLYCDVYASSANRAAQTSALTNLSLTLHAKNDFRYRYGFASSNAGNANAQSGTFANFTDLTISSYIVTDSVALSEVAASTSSYIVTDSVALSEVAASTAYLTQTDGIALSEGILLNGATYIFVTDGVALADDAVLNYKEVLLTDGINMVEVAGSVNQNSLFFAVTGFPSGQTVEYRIKTQYGVIVQDWTSVGVSEDLEITGYSTYSIDNVILENGFQGKVSWRINGTTYYAVKILNYFESFVFGQITVGDIEASEVLAKQTKLDFLEKWVLNKLVESADGTTVTLYDDDGTTPLKVWPYNSATKTRGRAT